jgi:hypothetical protein
VIGGTDVVGRDRTIIPTSTTSTATIDPAGFSLVVNATNNSVFAGESAIWFRSTDVISYERNARRWLDVYVDDGGHYFKQTSRGPVNGEWTWHLIPGSYRLPPGIDSFDTRTMFAEGEVTSIGTYILRGRRVIIIKRCAKPTPL